MNFKPKTDEELAELNMIANGEYPFEVVGAEEKKSKKSGAPMIEMKVRVFYDGNRSKIITDYLLESIPHKLAHFCDTVGLTDHYIAGTLRASDCLRRAGRCRVGREIDKTGQYDPKNVIKDYICEENEMENGADPAEEQKPPADPSDDVPF